MVSHQDSTARKTAEERWLQAKAALEQANRGLDRALEREQRLSRTDGLTQIGNRRYFFDLATHEIAEARRYGRGLAIVLVDIDHFKRIGDTAGHQTGDEVLRCLAQTTQTHLREVDILGRYGGEEFIVLLPGSNAPEAAKVAERIRASITADCQVQERPGVTVSVGVAEFPGHASGLEPLIRCADRALYEAKRAGRNRTIIFSAQDGERRSGEGMPLESGARARADISEPSPIAGSSNAISWPERLRVLPLKSASILRVFTSSLCGRSRLHPISL